MTEQASVSELLAESGFGHRHTESSEATGKHAVFALSTGEVIGQMTVFEAITFMDSERSNALTVLNDCECGYTAEQCARRCCSDSRDDRD